MEKEQKLGLEAGHGFSLPNAYLNVHCLLLLKVFKDNGHQTLSLTTLI